jgi:putative flippase GtrA
VYFLGSCLALVLDTVLLFLGRHLGMSLFWAVTLGFLSGSLVSYAVSSRLAYALRTARGEGASFLAFTIIGLFGLALTQLSLHGLTAAGWPLLAAKALTAGASFTCTFLLRKHMLFNTKVMRS